MFVFWEVEELRHYMMKEEQPTEAAATVYGKCSGYIRVVTT